MDALSWLEEDDAITKAKHAAIRALKRRTMHSGMLREKLMAKGHQAANVNTALEVLCWCIIVVVQGDCYISPQKGCMML